MREFSRGLLTTIRGISGITERKTTKKSQSSRSPHRDMKMAPIQYEAERYQPEDEFRSDIRDICNDTTGQ